MNDEQINITDQDIADDEKLMAYFRGELSAEDEAIFTERLKTDSALKERAIAVARLIKGLETEGTKLDNKIIKQDFGGKPTVVKFNAWIAAAAAVLVGVCIVFGVMFYNNQSIETLATQYQNELPLSEISRGSDDEDIDAKLQNLFGLVLQGQHLDNTIETLDGYWRQSLSESYNDFTSYSPQIGWFLAIAHLKNHDKSKAKDVLKTLIDNSEEGSALRNKAEELMGKL
jgi:hypothetical protein